MEDLTYKIIHHSDMDGYCAAAGVKLLTHNPFINFEYIGTNHNQPFPLDKIDSGDVVWILDFSTTPANMDAIIDRVGIEHVVWIDHHPYKYENYTREIAGIRDLSMSGCELTWAYIAFNIRHNWEFMSPTIDMLKSVGIPHFVKLIGDMDTFKWKFGDKTKFFINAMDGTDCRPDKDIWTELYENPQKLEEMIEYGTIIDTFLLNYFGRRLKANAFEADFQGQTILCINDRGGSHFFGKYYKYYPFVSTFLWDGEKFVCSLYSHPGENQVNVCEIARTLGGNGHIGAAGFCCEKIPYSNMRPVDWSKWKELDI